MKIYGISNCNTVKKTLDWLRLHQINFEFHDFKKLGISIDKLEYWSNQLGWDALLNKRGTTWKSLGLEIQQLILSKESAFKLMQEKVSVIKRPIIETSGGLVLLGYNEEQLVKLFN